MRSTLLAMVSSLLLAACAAPDTTADAAATDEPIVIRAENQRWSDLDPEGAPGVQIATLWGNPAEGGFGALLRLPAGFAAPLHTHTHDMKVVIVSGTYIQQPEGASEFRLGPASYLMQPGGNYRHTTSCDTTSDCVFFFESEGAFDLFVVNGAADQDQ